MSAEIGIGVVARTGSAVVVALSGPGGAPRFAGRWEIGLTGAGLPAQPYHVAAGMDLAAADVLVGGAVRAAEDAAAAGLRLVADGLPAAAEVLAVAVAVKPARVPDDLADVLRSHAWMHAAEGVLYREAVLVAARRCGWTPRAVDFSELPQAQRLVSEIGLAAGRPWRRIEKDAARAAIAALSMATYHRFGP
jgi:hypothetical protein